MRAIRSCAPILALRAATPARAQQADLGDPGTLTEASNTEDAAKRQHLRILSGKVSLDDGAG